MHIEAGVVDGMGDINKVPSLQLTYIVCGVSLGYYKKSTCYLTAHL